MKSKLVLIVSILFLCSSCTETILPKPKAYLSLEYPEASYQKVESNCPYSFEINQNSTIAFEKNCWAKINYPSINATIHVTYRAVNNNLDAVLKEVERLTYEHTIKADEINAQPYENEAAKVYGKMINIEGNVASNMQFHVTDSVRNILYGTLYFNVKPNYDSIYPAIKYIEKDIRNLMETVEWSAARCCLLYTSDAADE